ncbi:hypothetical protein BG011_001450, partial [Mortierella polycephala]
IIEYVEPRMAFNADALMVTSGMATPAGLMGQAGGVAGWSRKSWSFEAPSPSHQVED